MVEVPITIACGNYDRTRAIRDGRVKVEGCAVTYLPLYPEEIFFRTFRYQEFDVAELSFSSFGSSTLSRIAFGSSPAHSLLMPCRSASSYLSVWISDKSSKPV